MYLDIDGKTYIIHPKADIDAILLRNNTDESIHLDVPVNMPQANLITYIRTEFPKEINKRRKSASIHIESLKIFDKEYQTKVEDIDIPFIHTNILHVNAKSLKTKSSQENLRNILLFNLLNNRMSTLEEDLCIILPTIILKKLQTKYYSICHKTSTITYSKTLIEKSQDFITYVIILSVGNFLKYSEEEIEHLTKKYVSDWKHCERIWKYEQQ